MPQLYELWSVQTEGLQAIYINPRAKKLSLASIKRLISLVFRHIIVAFITNLPNFLIFQCPICTVRLQYNGRDLRLSAIKNDKRLEENLFFE